MFGTLISILKWAAEELRRARDNGDRDLVRVLRYSLRELFFTDETLALLKRIESGEYSNVERTQLVLRYTETRDGAADAVERIRSISENPRLSIQAQRMLTDLSYGKQRVRDDIATLLHDLHTNKNQIGISELIEEIVKLNDGIRTIDREFGFLVK